MNWIDWIGMGYLAAHAALYSYDGQFNCLKLSVNRTLDKAEEN
jgi:hypothetical protein